MFQYAAALALAEKLNTLIRVDIAAFDQQQFHHGFELGVFPNVKIEPAKGLIRSLFVSQNRLVRKLTEKLFGINRFVEPHFHYTPSWASLNGKNTYIVGYWQSEKYFRNIEKQVRHAFKFSPTLDELNQQVKNLCESTPTVSIHVRRGDYVNNASANAVHGTCDPKYYQAAIKHMQTQVTNPTFVVFSDDLTWTKSNLHLPDNTIFVDFNTGPNSWMDMRLMSYCHHHIIANSTFSWWGAWLNPNPQKIVIAPKHWFRDNKLDSSDLIPENWVRL